MSSTFIFVDSKAPRQVTREGGWHENIENLISFIEIFDAVTFTYTSFWEYYKVI